ncbi:unnamed protein product, partial [marine sediment metagenome]
IFWNNLPREIFFFGSTESISITIAYSDVQGRENRIVTNNKGTVNWLEGNIDVDPMFVAAENGNFQLQEGSLCIDAGTAFFVSEGDTLINLSQGDYKGLAPDMGASTDKAPANIINVPDDQPTIQAGIDVANDGDMVLIQPGTYVENINFNGKNIVVGSLFITSQDSTYISQTIIDGNQSGSVITFNSSEDSTAVLNGITLTNGSAQDGGGIYCVDSSPCLVNMTIIANTAVRSLGAVLCGNGGGIYFDNAHPSLVNVTIIGNSASKDGGGICCSSNSNPSLVDVTIKGNSASRDGGGICC